MSSPEAVDSSNFPLLTRSDPDPPRSRFSWLDILLLCIVFVIFFILLFRFSRQLVELARYHIHLQNNQNNLKERIDRLTILNYYLLGRVGINGSNQTIEENGEVSARYRVQLPNELTNLVEPIEPEMIRTD